MDLNAQITFLEGPLSAALPSLLKKEDLVGADLRDAWPDRKLERVVKEMIGNAKHSVRHFLFYLRLSEAETTRVIAGDDGAACQYRFDVELADWRTILPISTRSAPRSFCAAQRTLYGSHHRHQRHHVRPPFPASSLVVFGRGLIF